jgi:hypothetical protein
VVECPGGRAGVGKPDPGLEVPDRVLVAFRACAGWNHRIAGPLLVWKKHIGIIDEALVALLAGRGAEAGLPSHRLMSCGHGWARSW